MFYIARYHISNITSSSIIRALPLLKAYEMCVCVCVFVICGNKCAVSIKKNLARCPFSLPVITGTVCRQSQMHLVEQAHIQSLLFGCAHFRICLFTVSNIYDDTCPVNLVGITMSCNSFYAYNACLFTISTYKIKRVHCV